MKTINLAKGLEPAQKSDLKRKRWAHSEVSHLVRWDLDKTYLSTDFDSLRGLMKTAFQSAEDKKNVPGAKVLLRHLSDSSEEECQVHVHFISGSPRQMRRVIEKKLTLDGIAYQDLRLKPNLVNLARGRFRAVKEQVCYKLPILLRGRLSYGPNVPEILFGDDAESDAYVYSLYADYMGGRVEWEEVEAVLVACGVYPDVLEGAQKSRKALERGDCVESIYINLDRRSNLTRFMALSDKVVPVYNYWQAALCLREKGRISARGAMDVCNTLLSEYDFSVPRIRNSTEELMRRRQLSPKGLMDLVTELEAVNAEEENVILSLKRLSESPPKLSPLEERDDEASPDYLERLVQDREARERAKAADMASKRARAAQKK